MSSLLAFRFDVDSVTCVERGIPELRRLADRLGVRFTFFVNMGYSFNWTHNLRHLLRRRARGRPTGSAPGRTSLPTTKKLGWAGVAKTVIQNPALGEKYRATFDALHAEGHELGLHGGTDHVIWQRSLDELGSEGLERLFRPAYERFSERYGRPRGFASPGFRWNDAVLRLMDDEGFDYASDLPGDTPFHPEGEDGTTFRHYQVPVNVAGDHLVPVIEQGLARGLPRAEIVRELVAMIRARPFALAYGHPYVEGVEADLLEGVMEQIIDSHEVVTLTEYVARWDRQHG